jgi:multisubunit Na+/H+ antiporter MnhF subunit
MNTYTSYCSNFIYDGDKIVEYDCVGTTTPVSDNMATTSLIYRNQITPDNLLNAALLIFIGITAFSHFIFDVFFIKKLKLKQ